MAKWQGPYEVQRKVGPVTYEIEIPSRNQPLQIFHINMLKKWHPRAQSAEPVRGATDSVADNALFVKAVEEEVEEQYLLGRQGKSELNLEHLSEGQRQQLSECLPDQLFMETPGRTDLVSHSIVLKDPNPILPASLPCARTTTVSNEAGARHHAGTGSDQAIHQ